MDTGDDDVVIRITNKSNMYTSVNASVDTSVDASVDTTLQDYIKNKDYFQIYNIIKTRTINKKINNYVYIVYSLLQLQMGNTSHALYIINNLKNNNTTPNNIHIIYKSYIIILKKMGKQQEAEELFEEYIKMNNSNYYYNLFNKILDDYVLIETEINNIFMELIHYIK